MPHDLSRLFIELGCAIIGLAALAWIAGRWRFSAIPLYLLAGLAFGNGGIAPLDLSQDFIHIGAEIGVLLLLFMLGLEYSGEELRANLRSGLLAGVVDFLLNFPPGFIAGFLLGWNPLAAVLLGGVTYISSSGLVAKILSDLGWMGNPEMHSVLSILVIEDLAMAVYLPVIAALLLQGGAVALASSVAISVAVVLVVFFVAVRYGPAISRFAADESDEIILLSIFGTVLFVAGLAQHFQVSAAIAAFLAGIAISEPLHKRSHRLFAPLRDLFAALFFFFFGLAIDPAMLPPALVPAAILAAITALTKIATGYWAARRAVSAKDARLRAGIALVSRGEFSIVIAGLGAGVEPKLGAVSAGYVLIMAILGPLLARVVSGGSSRS